jgi:hypothetical protein
MIMPIANSRTFQEIGFSKKGLNNLAPKPSKKKNINEADIAPAANSILVVSYFVEMVPNKTPYLGKHEDLTK